MGNPHRHEIPKEHICHPKLSRRGGIWDTNEKEYNAQEDEREQMFAAPFRNNET